MNIDHLISDVESELTNLFYDKLAKIILYGSYARGDYDDDSDVDIIALIDDDNLKKYEKEILMIDVDLSLKYDVDLSIFIENSDEFALNKSVIPLYKNIAGEGVNIHAV
ncbi:MAG: nucleotidyltransferase domain-containing protein [Candidatus Aminicenantes bacterium]|nr:nucleotidyltransferase domain-containing protein [Candidatus Aminicenantes bacterium]